MAEVPSAELLLQDVTWLKSLATMLANDRDDADDLEHISPQRRAVIKLHSVSRRHTQEQLVSDESLPLSAW